MKLHKICFLGSFEAPKRAGNKKPEIALIGRSNVGKSSLINALLQQKKMALVSSKPGKTKRLNYFLVNERFCLVDLPGYGWAKADRATRSLISTITRRYLEESPCLYLLLVLIDIRLPPQKIDQDFLLNLGRRELPFTIVFTKQDKVSAAKARANRERFQSFLAEHWDPLPPTLMTSALKRVGLEALHKNIADALALEANSNPRTETYPPKKRSFFSKKEPGKGKG